MYLSFQKVIIQVCPRPIIFLYDNQPEPLLGDDIKLKADTSVSCSVRVFDDGIDPVRYYEQELSESRSGFAAVDDDSSECAIYLYLSRERFSFFYDSLKLTGLIGITIRVILVPEPESSYVRKRHVYMLEQNPTISINLAGSE